MDSCHLFKSAVHTFYERALHCHNYLYLFLYCTKCHQIGTFEEISATMRFYHYLKKPCCGFGPIFSDPDPWIRFWKFGSGSGSYLEMFVNITKWKHLMTLKIKDKTIILPKLNFTQCYMSATLSKSTHTYCDYLYPPQWVGWGRGPSVPTSHSLIIVEGRREKHLLCPQSGEGD